jgi:antitoxin (DNA-binding transcriptional repressor) of toxin-antitoxin stability system
MSELGGDDDAARPGGPVYALGSSPAERDRLRRQSAELAGHSATLLDRVGLGPGQARPAWAVAPAGSEAAADIYPAGHSRRTIRIDLVRSMRSKILERQLADDRELEELDRAAREHLGDPDTLVLPHLLFLAWGRKPLT